MLPFDHGCIRYEESSYYLKHNDGNISCQPKEK